MQAAAARPHRCLCCGRSAIAWVFVDESIERRRRRRRNEIAGSSVRGKANYVN
jgi:hypothetical protein